LDDCFDGDRALRANQPLKLSNNLSLRGFIPEYNPR
jgi:hypothetical protein